IRPTLLNSARIAAISFIGALIITLIFSAIAFRPLGRLGHMLDLLSRGEYEYPETTAPPPATADELTVMASKVSMLGEQLRGARYDFSDLRGNFERLLDDLVDAILIFGRDRRLVIASGAVERYLGKMRSDLLNQPMTDIFPPSTAGGVLLARSAQTGRPIRNRRVPLSSAVSAPGTIAV